MQLHHHIHTPEITNTTPTKSTGGALHLILFAMIAGALLGRLERHVPEPVQAQHSHVQVFRLHDVAALPDRGDGLQGFQGHRFCC